VVVFSVVKDLEIGLVEASVVDVDVVDVKHAEDEFTKR